MEAMVNSLILLLMMIFLLAGGVWIFGALILISVISLSVLLGYPMDRIGAIMVKRLGRDHVQDGYF
jgi:hypothetical protein